MAWRFEDMLTFLKVVEAGGVTAAAAELKLSKSVVSKRVSDLEDALGLSLLRRSTRHVTPTERGRSLYEQMRPAFGALRLFAQAHQRIEQACAHRLGHRRALVGQHEARTLAFRRQRQPHPAVFGTEAAGIVDELVERLHQTLDLGHALRNVDREQRVRAPVEAEAAARRQEAATLAGTGTATTATALPGLALVGQQFGDVFSVAVADRNVLGHHLGPLFQGETRGLMLGEEFHHNRIQVISSQISAVAPEASHRWSKLRLWQTAVRLQHEGRLNLLPLITHAVAFAEAPSLFQRLDAGDPDILQSVLTFGTG